MLLLGEFKLLQEEMMEKLHFMKRMETAFNEWIIQKMRKSKNLLKLLLIRLERQQLLETLIDFMFTTITQRDLNGMRYVVNR